MGSCVRLGDKTERLVGKIRWIGDSRRQTLLDTGTSSKVYVRRCPKGRPRFSSYFE